MSKAKEKEAAAKKKASESGLFKGSGKADMAELYNLVPTEPHPNAKKGK